MILTFAPNIYLLVFLLISCVVNCIITFDSGDLTTNISATRISTEGKVSVRRVINCKIEDHRFGKKCPCFPCLLFQIKLVLLIESLALFSAVSIIFMTDFEYVLLAVF